MDTSTEPVALDRERTTAGATDRADRPLGFIGVVSPMTNLGLAPFSYLGVVYREGLALSSAALYQVTFSRQQERIVDDLLEMPLAEARAWPKVRFYERNQIERAELCRQFATGYRLDLTMRGGTTTRLIVQARRLDDIRRWLPEVTGAAWSDATLEAA